MHRSSHDLLISSYVDPDHRGVLLLTGDVDLDTGPHLRDRILEMAEGCTTVVLDLEHVHFMDSPGLGILIHAHQRLAERGARLILHAPRGDVLNLFDLVQLDSELTIERT